MQVPDLQLNNFCDYNINMTNNNNTKKYYIWNEIKLL